MATPRDGMGTGRFAALPSISPADEDSSMAPQVRGAGAMGGDGLVAANGPDLQMLEHELQLAREIVFELRNPVGAVRMAVQMLNGPLKKLLSRLDARDRVTVESVLTALDSSTHELCQAVGRLNTNPTTTSLRRRPTPASAPPLAAVPTVAPVVPDPPRPRAPAQTRPPRSPVVAVVESPVARADGGTEVAALLSRLEVMVVTRSALPAMLAVNAQGPLPVTVPGPDLLRALGYLVENALEASAGADPKGGPWTVEVRAFSDLREVLGDEMDVVIEIVDSGPGIPEPVRQWFSAPRTGGPPPSKKTERSQSGGLAFVRSVVEGGQGTLEVRRVRNQTVVTVRLPSRPRR